MRILKTVILCLAFVLAVFLCSANVHSVALNYIPDIGLPQLGEPRSIEAPLFLLILASVALGLILGGGGALFEQARLKLELRQAKKTADRCREEAMASDSDLGVEREEVARLKAQVTSLRREHDALAEPAEPVAHDPELGEDADEGAPFEAAPSDEEGETPPGKS